MLHESHVFYVHKFHSAQFWDPDLIGHVLWFCRDLWSNLLVFNRYTLLLSHPLATGKALLQHKPTSFKTLTGTCLLACWGDMWVAMKSNNQQTLLPTTEVGLSSLWYSPAAKASLKAQVLQGLKKKKTRSMPMHFGWFDIFDSPNWSHQTKNRWIDWGHLRPHCLILSVIPFERVCVCVFLFLQLYLCGVRIQSPKTGGIGSIEINDSQRIFLSVLALPL